MQDLSLQHTYLECLLSWMFPPAAVNGLFDLLLPPGQVPQELQHDPTQNTKEILTETFPYFNILLVDFQLHHLKRPILINLATLTKSFICASISM